MELNIKNIGKIKKANVELNGITVIGGENNTGKSTVSKALYSVLTSLNNKSKKVELERKNMIFNLVYRYCYLEKDFNIDYLNKIESLEKFLFSSKDINFEQLKEKIKNVVGTEQNQDIKKLIENVKRALTLDESKIINKFLDNKFEIEFNGQLYNIYENDLQSILNIKSKKDEIKIEFKENRILNIQGNFRSKSIIYIENPFVLDEYNKFEINRRINRSKLNHNKELILNILKINEKNIIEEIQQDEKLKLLNDKLEKIVLGNVRKKNYKLVYIHKNKELNIENLSSGMKSFLILKMLLQNGALSENGMLVLDEPEIHLHPEWQIVFAEIIVLFYKILNIRILLTSHSPYFVSALEIYSKKYGVEDKCEYYIAENEGNYSNIKKVNKENNEIYLKLAKPFQKLEDLEYGD